MNRFSIDLSPRTVLLAFLVVIFSATFALSSVIHVPDDYVTPQIALDAASAGDTILVADGIYGTAAFPSVAVTLASHFLVDGDTSHINQTILQGSGIIVSFFSGEDSTSVLEGFTIRGGTRGVYCHNASPTIRNNFIMGNSQSSWEGYAGSGITLLNSDAHILENLIEDNSAQAGEFSGFGTGIYCEVGAPRIQGNIIRYNSGLVGWMGSINGGGIGCLNSTPVIVDNEIYGNTIQDWGTGGGIFCYQSNAVIRNNLIAGNSAGCGGGIALTGESDALLEGNTIRENEITRDYTIVESPHGAGIYVWNSTPTLGTEENPLNIYHNMSAWGKSVSLKECGPLTVIADTVDAENLDNRFFMPSDSVTVQANTVLYAPVNAPEVYVGPDGDDSNSGLSEDQPFRSLYGTLARIPVAPDQPVTVHLLPGTYSPDDNGQIFPFCVGGNITLAGDTSIVTILQGRSGHDILWAFDVGDVILQDLSLVGGVHGVYAHEAGLTLDRMVMTNMHEGAVVAENSSTLDVRDSRFMYCQGTNYIAAGVNALYCDQLQVIDSRFMNNDATAILCQNTTSTLSGNRISDNANTNTGSFTAGGVEVIQSTVDLLNNLIVNNSAMQTGAVFMMWASEVSMINNTIVNNVATAQGGVGGISSNSDATLSMVNCILYGNHRGEDETQIDDNASTSVTYSIVQGGWDGVGNLDVDPSFQEEINYFLNNASPAVDAGNPYDLYNDREDPSNPGFALLPGQGTVRNDLGAYGGQTPYLLANIQSGVEDPVRDTALPRTPVIESCYPNPFNASATIRYTLPKAGHVRIDLMNLLGRKVLGLVDGTRTAGRHELHLDAERLASGVYFLRLNSRGGVDTKRVVLVK